jgi:hypothetical protein
LWKAGAYLSQFLDEIVEGHVVHDIDELLDASFHQ